MVAVSLLELWSLRPKASGANDQDLFENLLDSPNPMRMVSGMSAPIAARLLRYAQRHYETTINSRREDIERDIEVSWYMHPFNPADRSRPSAPLVRFATFDSSV